MALDDAAPLYHDAPEAQEVRAAGDRIVQVFMQEALPEASAATRALAGDLITTTLGAVGKQFSESPRASAEIEAYAAAMADMFCAYLKGLATRLRYLDLPSGVDSRAARLSSDTSPGLIRASYIGRLAARDTCAELQSECSVHRAADRAAAGVVGAIRDAREPVAAALDREARGTALAAAVRDALLGRGAW
jgi:hypothetical protein